MNGEYIIDSWLDWLAKDDYVWDEDSKQWVYNGGDEHQQESEE